MVILISKEENLKQLKLGFLVTNSALRRNIRQAKLCATVVKQRPAAI